MNKLSSIFKNQNFYIAVISLVIFLFTLIKYLPLVILGVSIGEDMATPIIVLVLLGSLVSLIISLKNINANNHL
ncbi:MAG: hypothetical protein PHF67_00420 [Candidatus Nanoarchaeia archaeon]|nr:hypothetical protein [Candidatus Nanoarchaeia archaeon]